MAVAYCTPVGAAQIRPTDGLLHNQPLPKFKGLYRSFWAKSSKTISPYGIPRPAAAAARRTGIITERKAFFVPSTDDDP